ncbi:MAG: phage holin family protein [Flavobacteriales bacterium]
MQLLIRLLITTIAVLITDLLLPGVSLGDMSNTNGLITALLVAVVLGLLNTFLKPLLILFTLPATLLTMGLFLLVINSAIVMLAGRIVEGFEVNGWWWALAFSVCLSIVQGFLQALDKPKPGAEQN